MTERIDASFEPESGYLFAHVDPERVKALMMECGTSVQFVIDLDHAPDPHGRRILTAIDQLRRDLSEYHGQLKAHSDLQTHCDRQRERIACLEGLYKKVKAENARLRELVNELYPLADYGAMDTSELDRAHDLMRELGIEVGR